MTEEKLVEEILDIASELDRGDINFDEAKEKAELLVRIDRYEQLRIGGVRQQRELLDFLDWVGKNTPSYSVQNPKQIVQAYLKSNCG